MLVAVLAVLIAYFSAVYFAVYYIVQFISLSGAWVKNENGIVGIFYACKSVYFLVCLTFLAYWYLILLLV